MYRCIDVTNGAAAVYFILAVIVGSYFMLNLFLAVLKLKFAKAQAQLLHINNALELNKK